jgi:hypothetical protein
MILLYLFSPFVPAILFLYFPKSLQIILMPDKHALILQPGIGLGAACYNKTGIVYYHAGFEKSLIYFSIQALEAKIIKAS